MNWGSSFAATLCCLLAMSGCGLDAHPPDEQEVRAELAALSQVRLDAYNSFETERFISFHMADDKFVYTREGQIIQGIEAWAAAVRAGHESFADVSVSIVSEDISVLRPDVAVMTQVFDISGSKHSGDKYAGRGTQTLVWQKRGGDWVVVNLAETKSKDYGER